MEFAVYDKAGNLQKGPLGFNVLYEMAKRFCAGTEDAVKRGRELFNYMKNYLALRIPIVKENWALLVEEALDVTDTEPMESCFRNDRDYRTTVEEVNKLCEGNFEAEAARFIENRKSKFSAEKRGVRIARCNRAVSGVRFGFRRSSR